MDHSGRILAPVGVSTKAGDLQVQFIAFGLVAVGGGAQWSLTLAGQKMVLEATAIRSKVQPAGKAQRAANHGEEVGQAQMLLDQAESCPKARLPVSIQG
jgi:hypothetical protein